jgi:hypothetical protein
MRDAAPAFRLRPVGAAAAARHFYDAHHPNP